MADEQSLDAILPTILDEANYRDLTRMPKFGENIQPHLYTEVDWSSSDSWVRLSFVQYNTTRLAWLIMAFNSIENPFAMVEVGRKIKIPTPATVRHILTKMRIDK